MTKHILLLLVLIGTFAITSIKPSHAQSDKDLDCGIWICLPGGFPGGCEPYHDRLKERLKEGKGPLISLSSCGGGSSKGTKYGREYYHACRSGFKLVTTPDDRTGEPTDGRCINQRKCVTREGRDETRRNCGDYKARKRSKQRFVDMVIDGERLGKFYY